MVRTNGILRVSMISEHLRFGCIPYARCRASKRLFCASRFVITVMLFFSAIRVVAQSGDTGRSAGSDREILDGVHSSRSTNAGENSQPSFDWDAVDDAELIRLLTQKLQGQRQSAMLEVWRRRDTLRETVQRLHEGSDPEARARAIWILDQWGRGALPKTPKEVVRSLSELSGKSSLRSLLDRGDFQAVVIALEETAGRLEGRAIRDRLAVELMNGFPLYVVHAYETNLLTDLLGILDLVSNSVELAICRFSLMRELGIAITDENLMPPSSSDWTPLLRLQAECVLSVLQGNEDRARALANQSIDPELMMRFQMVSGHWGEMAETLVVRARAAVEGSLERTRLWALVFSASERALVAKETPAEVWRLRTEAFENLTSEKSDQSAEGKLAAGIRWKVLASHAEVEQALAILRELSRSDAASLSQSSARISESFEFLEYPLSKVDQDLDQWIAEAIDQQKTWKMRDLSPKMREMLTLMQCLIGIGRDEIALEIANELALSDVLIGSLPLREFVISTLSLTKKIDWMIAIATANDAGDISPETFNTIARSLPDCDLVTLQTTVEALEHGRPDETLGVNFRDAVSLFMNRENLEETKLDQCFAILFSYLLSDQTSSEPNVAQQLETQGRLSLKFVSLFQNNDKNRYAEICLHEMIRLGDPEAALLMAERKLESGNVGLAESLFMQTLPQIEGSSLRNKKFGPDADHRLWVRARIGLWRIAKIRQDETTALSRFKAVRYAMCTPNLSARNEIAEYLAEHNEPALAAEIFEDLLPIVAMGQRGRLALYDVARRYSPLVKDQQPGRASQWFDLALQQTLWSVDFRAGAYVTLPMFAHRWALEEEIKTDQRDKVVLRLDRMLRLDPMDIDIAERLLPMMRENGMEEDSIRVLDRIIDLGLDHADRYPFDAMTSNNVAWIAAVNERRLDDALRLSRVAVTAEPDSAIYRDTLAEVLYKLKRPVEASQIERGCLLDDPTQWHLHQQYEKYRTDFSGK